MRRQVRPELVVAILLVEFFVTVGIWIGVLAESNAAQPNPVAEAQADARQARIMANLVGPLLRQVADSQPRTVVPTPPTPPMGDWREFSHKGLDAPRVEETLPTTPTTPSATPSTPAAKPATRAQRLYDAEPVVMTPTPALATAPAPAVTNVTVNGGNAQANAVVAASDDCCDLRVQNARLWAENVWMTRAMTAERELAVRKEFEVKDLSATTEVVKLLEKLVKSGSDSEVTTIQPQVHVFEPGESVAIKKGDEFIVVPSAPVEATPATTSTPATRPATKVATPTPPLPSTKALLKGLVHDADKAEAERDDAQARLTVAEDRIKLLEEELRLAQKVGGKKGKSAKRLKY